MVAFAVWWPRMEIRCPHCLVRICRGALVDRPCLPFLRQGRRPVRRWRTTCSYRPGVQVLGHFELLHEVRDRTFRRRLEGSRHATAAPRGRRDLSPSRTISIRSRQNCFCVTRGCSSPSKSPATASVHEVGREGDTVYIVSDFIDGADLTNGSAPRLTPATPPRW